jgi:hypothetical protein
LMRSRRRIATLISHEPQAGCDYSRDLRSAKWGSGLGCTVAIVKRECLLWVKRTFRSDQSMSAIPPKADIKLSFSR